MAQARLTEPDEAARHQALRHPGQDSDEQAGPVEQDLLDGLAGDDQERRRLLRELIMRALL